MPTVRTRTTDTYYEILGAAGAPLVLVNGLGSNILTWDTELRDALSRRHRCLAFDNRGVGRSAVPEDGYTIEQFADDAVALFDALDLGRVHLVGASMGGLIAQEIAIRAPERLLSLSLCCTFPGFGRLIPPAPEVVRTLLESGQVEAAAGIRLSWTICLQPEFIEREREWLEQKLQQEIRYPCPPAVHQKHFHAAATWDNAERLFDLTVPTLVLTGEDDILIPPGNSATLARMIPGARLCTYPNAGHGFLTEQREAAVADLLAHTGAHEPQGARR